MHSLAMVTPDLQLKVTGHTLPSFFPSALFQACDAQAQALPSMAAKSQHFSLG